MRGTKYPENCYSFFLDFARFTGSQEMRDVSKDFICFKNQNFKIYGDKFINEKVHVIILTR